MSNESKIVIISDNLSAKEILLKKINLLREADAIESYGYAGAVSYLSASLPELIILYADVYNNANCFKLLREIKNIPDFESVPVMLVCEKNDRDFILSAFDEGISDYILIDADESEFLIRIIWNLQKRGLLKKYNESLQQLVDMDVVYDNTFFYKEAFVDTIFKANIKKCQEKNIITTLMIISSDIDCKYQLSSGLLGNILKETLRKTDVIGVKDNDKFYVLLNDISPKNAEAMFNRIQKELDEYSISAGVTCIGFESFEKAENDAKKALQDALLQKNKVVFYGRNLKGKEGDCFSEEADMTSPNKNFKLFKQSFIKKLNNVITPVFYQIQKMYEDKLFETKILQTTTEGRSVFYINSKDVQSKLTITYPGFSKINIKTEHTAGSEVQSDSISLKLPELDSAELTKIMEQFIKDYKEISGN